jgi:hypothetical protein
MKRYLLLGAIALTLSGCVSEDPGYGSRYDRYPGAYDQRPVRVDRDRYRPAPIYRDDRAYRDDRYDRIDDRRSYRDYRRSDRRDDGRFQDNRNSGRYDRRGDAPIATGIRPEGRQPDTRPQDPGTQFRPRIVTGQMDGAPGGQICQQGVFNDCGGAGQNAGPQPYRPPVRSN